MTSFKHIAMRLLPPVLVPKAWGSPFEAANWSPRRGTVPGASPSDARNELTPGVRTELVRKSRYLHKNSGFMRELVANMAIYSTGDGIRVQAQSAKPEWNRAAEAYFALWSARCEVTRHKQAPGLATIKTGDKPAVTLVNNLDYIEDVSTYKGINLALQVADGRLRKSLIPSRTMTPRSTNGKEAEILVCRTKPNAPRIQQISSQATPSRCSPLNLGQMDV